MPSPGVARLRLLSLSVAVAAQAACLATIVAFALERPLGDQFASYKPDVLAAWLGLSAVPALLLSPLIGPVAGSRWSRGALLGSAAVGTAVISAGLIDPTVPWLTIAGILVLASAVFGTAVLASLPGIATAARMEAPTVLVGVSIALFAALYLGLYFGTETTDSPSPPQLAVALGILAIIGSALAPQSVGRPAPLSGGLIQAYLAGTRDAISHRQSRIALAGLWLWAFIAMAIAVVAIHLNGVNNSASTPGDDPKSVTAAARWLGSGLLGGLLLAGLNRHHYRHAWLIPYAGTACLACLIWLRFGQAWETPILGVGLALGASFTGLVNAYQTWTAAAHRGVGAVQIVTGACVAALVLAIVLPEQRPDLGSTRKPLLNILIGCAAVAAVGAWLGYVRAAIEGTCEFPLRVLYRIRIHGPDIDRLPSRGPCLVISNHAAWFDPLWLGKALPAPITPMMTSKFYDLPVISWLMRNVYGTIRVPEVPYRHEAPELQEAVRALDAAACVVLFPEGYLRRKDEQPLRRFGRGVWRILSDRPETPVFACWIEGGWGSYFSYRGGPPTKNKKMDFQRSIRIGVIGPFTVSPTLLADHMATRKFLMERVNAARAPLGLEPLHLPDVRDGEKE